MARLLFHRVVQEEHPEVTQQVGGRSTSAVGVKCASIAFVLNSHDSRSFAFYIPSRYTFCSVASNKLPQTVNPTPLCFHQIAASLEKNLLPRLSNSPPDIESLRLYLTLPECPLFCDRNNYVTIAIPFAKSIISLKEAALKVLGSMKNALLSFLNVS